MKKSNGKIRAKEGGGESKRKVEKGRKGTERGKNEATGDKTSSSDHGRKARLNINPGLVIVHPQMCACVWVSVRGILDLRPEVLTGASALSGKTFASLCTRTCFDADCGFKWFPSLK